MSRQLWVTDLGTLPYGEALALQRAAAQARIAGSVPQDLLLLVEHPPVVTLGRATRRTLEPSGSTANQPSGVSSNVGLMGCSGSGGAPASTAATSA